MLRQDPHARIPVSAPVVFVKGPVQESPERAGSDFDLHERDAVLKEDGCVCSGDDCCVKAYGDAFYFAAED